jgi:hypothetical protein
MLARSAVSEQLKGRAPAGCKDLGQPSELETTTTHLFSIRFPFILTRTCTPRLADTTSHIFDLSAHARTYFNPKHWLLCDAGLCVELELEQRQAHVLHKASAAG